MSGKLIAIHGINGIGKTTQCQLLTQFLVKQGRSAIWLKFPLYALSETGPEIWRQLRDPSSAYHQNPRQFGLQTQALFAANYYEIEPVLRQLLDAGIDIIAEAYTPLASFVWSYLDGVSDKDIETLYLKGYLEPDSQILLSGKRFRTAIEANHINESNEIRMQAAKRHFESVAKKHGWQQVNANQPPEQVQQDILKLIRPLLR